MGVFKKLRNMIFGSSEENVNESTSEKKATLNVVYRKSDSVNKIGGYALENEEYQKEISCTNIDPVNDIFQAKGDSINHGVFGFEPTVYKQEINNVIKENVAKKKKIIGQKTLSDIKDYLLTYGSLDVLTCKQKFKVKSLHNFIWHLRKEGFEIKTGKILLHDEFGDKVQVVNYRLISKK